MYSMRDSKNVMSNTEDNDELRKVTIQKCKKNDGNRCASNNLTCYFCLFFVKQTNKKVNLTFEKQDYKKPP